MTDLDADERRQLEAVVRWRVQQIAPKDGWRGCTTVMVDLDSTLADTSHRADQMPSQEDWDSPDAWKDYHQGCLMDAPIWPTVYLVRELAAAGNLIHVVTSRSDRALSDTTHWLRAVAGVPFDALAMCPNERWRDAWKPAWRDAVHHEGGIVTLCLDDWPGTRAAMHPTPTVIINPMRDVEGGR